MKKILWSCMNLIRLTTNNQTSYLKADNHGFANMQIKNDNTVYTQKNNGAILPDIHHVYTTHAATKLASAPFEIKSLLCGLNNANCVNPVLYYKTRIQEVVLYYILQRRPTFICNSQNLYP